LIKRGGDDGEHGDFSLLPTLPPFQGVSGQYPNPRTNCCRNASISSRPDYHEKLQQLGSDALHQLETVLLPNSTESHATHWWLKEFQFIQKLEVAVLLRIKGFHLDFDYPATFDESQLRS